MVSKSDGALMALVAALIIFFITLLTFVSTAHAQANYYTETVTPLAANGIFTGATHDLGTAPPAYSYVGCAFIANQTGTDNLDTSVDGTNWFVALTGAQVANTTLDLKATIRSRYWRCRMVNGATLQTSLRITSSITAD